MTIDKLNAEGWDIGTEIFSDQALQTEALLSDAVQFTSGNPLAARTAIQEGVPLALVGERSANDWIGVWGRRRTSSPARTSPGSRCPTRARRRSAATC